MANAFFIHTGIRALRSEEILRLFFLMAAALTPLKPLRPLTALMPPLKEDKGCHSERNEAEWRNPLVESLELR
ncbi:MAG: hypothetical protein IKQ09_02430 [Bacteroidales bacterium]|nr:hypothetical protein [Bacteroidales bacterium]